MILSKSKIFLFCCLALIFGIGLASFLPLSFLAPVLWYFSFSLACLLISILFWQNQKIRLASLLGLFLFLGIWRYALALPVDSVEKIWHYNGQAVEISGRIADEPDIREKNQKLEIKVEKLALSDRKTSHLYVSGRVLVTTNLYPQFNYGDEVKIMGELQTPEEFNGFAYDRYLARYNIYSVSYYPEIKKIKTGQGNKFLTAIFNFKNKIRGNINRSLSEPQASLASGILIGDTRGFTTELRQIFSRSGLSHLTAVSGMNISIIAAVLMSVLLFLNISRRWSFYISVFFLIAFIILVGLPASALRAGLMGFLVLWALHLGRLNKLTNSLVLTAAILLFLNPRMLRDDIGFQLSFLAILGLVYAYPPLNALFDKIKIPEFHGARDVLLLTLAAQVFTWPIIAYNFSIVSLIAPFSNLAVLWCVAILTIALMAATALSLFLPVLGFWLFAPLDWLLRYIVKVAEVSANTPLAYIELSHLSLLGLIAYYALVGGGIFFQNKRLQEKNARPK